jgi:hypothetical protein
MMYLSDTFLALYRPLTSMYCFFLLCLPFKLTFGWDGSSCVEVFHVEHAHPGDPSVSLARLAFLLQGFVHLDCLFVHSS